jgi:hypothetical protein
LNPGALLKNRADASEQLYQEPLGRELLSVVDRIAQTGREGLGIVQEIEEERRV